MLVSNDRNLRRQFRACLSDIGVAAGALTKVRNGKDCLTALAKERPRLVVLDDSITDWDGPDLLRALHQRDPEMLVIYLTALHTPELEREVRQSGTLYYTEKPLDLLLLGRVLSAVFGSSGEPRIPLAPRRENAASRG